MTNENDFDLMIIVLFWRQMGKQPETENQRLNAEACFIIVCVISCIYSM